MREWQKNILASAIAALVAAAFVVVLILVVHHAIRSDRDAEEHRLPQPTSKVLDELRQENTPIYWLGHSFGSLKLSGAEVSGGRVLLAYGAPSCYSDPSSGSGCSYPLTISSGESRPSPFLPPAGREHVCLKHIGATVAVFNCLFPTQAMLYSGSSATWLRAAPYDKVSVEEVARHLTAINARRLVRVGRIPDVAHELPRPEPIPCPSLRFIVRWWTRTVEKGFGPNPRCQPYGT